ncbi:hypothetical protein AOQ71_01475 [Bradyrhizobium manausense]|uniref:Uncharacterized protein n=1 Tax=Bradyrhizobium manausense TaxID=989370 RepID=A0A0R3E5V0_9BRAD|nr:hypothetical protein AOQ71_01475 [Bradyrhizobium manausense]
MDDWLGIREGREALLRVADVAQQRDRIESGIDFLEMVANCVRRAGVGGQALVGVLPARCMSCAHEHRRAAWLSA